MSWRRRAVALFLAASGLLPAAACRRGAREPRHAAAPQTPAQEPTPDTTPIELLKTPAGLVLRPERPSLTPSPVAVPTAPSGGGS
jgi:hypothetical protein